MSVGADIGVDSRRFDELGALGERQAWAGDEAAAEAAAIETYGRAVSLYGGDL